MIVLLFSGTLSPTATGIYEETGTYAGKPAYRRQDNAYWIWWSEPDADWYLTAGPVPAATNYPVWLVHQDDPAPATYTPANGATGDGYLDYLPAPTAVFTATPTEGAAPLTVVFADVSTGTPTAWAWDFGDGSTSTSQNPSHAYAGAGEYTATLVATNAGGASAPVSSVIHVHPVINEATLREIFAEDKARIVKGQESELLEGGRLFRYWPDCERAAWYQGIPFLKTYASAKNTVAGDTVLDPMVDGQRIPGTFILLNVQIFYDPTGRLNLYEELIRPEDHTWTTGNTSAAAGGVATIHTQTAQITSFARSAGTIRHVRQEKTEAGKFRTDDEVITPVDQATHILEDSAARSVDTATHTESTELGAPTATAGTIKKNTNRPTEAGNFATDAMVVTVKDQVSNSSADSAAAASAIVEHSQAAAEVTGSAAAGTVRRIGNQQTEAGKFATRDEVITPKDQATHVLEDSAARSVDTATHTESTELSAPTATAGTVKKNTNRPTEAGNFATEAMVVTVKDQESTSVTDSAAAWSVTTEHTQATNQAQGSASAGTIRKISNQPTEAGKFATRDEIITPVNQHTHILEDSAARSVDTATNTESTELSAPTATAGTIKKNTNRPTEAGNFASEAMVVTVKDQTSTSSTDSAAASSAIVEHTQAAAEVSGSASAGTVRRIANQQTEAGKFATRDEVITPKNQHTHVLEDSAARSVDTATNTESTELSAPTATAGTVKRNTNRPTEAGNFATEAMVVTVKDQTSTSSTDSAAASSAIVEHTQAAAEVTGSAAAGTVRRIGNQQTEAGKFATRDEVITPKDQTAHEYEEDYGKSVVRTSHTESTELSAPTPASGTTKKNTSRQTEAGNFATVAEVITPKRQVWSKSYATRWGNAFYKRVTNATDAELAADTDLSGLTNETSNSVSGGENDADLNDYQITKQPNAGTSGSDDAWDNFTSTTSFTWFQFARIRGTRKKREVTTTYAIKQCTNHTTAYAFVTSSDGADHAGSHVEVFGGGKNFRAIFITNSYGTWTTDE